MYNIQNLDSYHCPEIYWLLSYPKRFIFFCSINKCLHIVETYASLHIFCCAVSIRHRKKKHHHSWHCRWKKLTTQTKSLRTTIKILASLLVRSVIVLWWIRGQNSTFFAGVSRCFCVGMSTSTSSTSNSIKGREREGSNFIHITIRELLNNMYYC
jgi:hypothetical protein